MEEQLDRLEREAAAEKDKIAAREKAEAERLAKQQKEDDEAKAYKSRIDEIIRITGLTEESIVRFFDVCGEIGIDSETIKEIDIVDKDSGLFLFTYQNREYKVQFNAQNEVETLYFEEIRFVENGQNVGTLADRFYSSEELRLIQKWAKEAVLMVVKSPASAKFPGRFFTPYDDWRFYKNKNIYTVSSYVDSQNSFGAMIRSYFTIEFTREGDEANITNFVFDDRKIM